jgi:hypothetical protein
VIEPLSRGDRPLAVHFSVYFASSLIQCTTTETKEIHGIVPSFQVKIQLVKQKTHMCHEWVIIQIV